MRPCRLRTTYVRQLVDDQPLSVERAGRERTNGEEDVLADGERAGLQDSGGVCRDFIGVHAHAAEVDAEALLHPTAKCLGQRLAATLPLERRGEVRGIGGHGHALTAPRPHQDGRRTALGHLRQGI